MNSITKPQMAQVINRLLDVTQMSNNMAANISRPAENGQDSGIDVLIDFWYKKFKGEYFSDFVAAIDEYTDSNKFFPGVSDIKNIILVNKCPEFNETPDESYEEVMRLVNFHGRNGYSLAKKSLSELSILTCDVFGWERICNISSDREMFRIQYIKAYERIKAKEWKECVAINDNKYVVKAIEENKKQRLLIQSSNEKLLAESTKLIGTEKPVKEIDDEFRESDTDAYKLAKCREIRAMIMKGKDDDED